MPSPSDMNGKVAIVTGAAAGLGRATALILARAGADLCLVDINAEGLQETATVAQNAGVKTRIEATDLSDTSRCGDIVESTVEELGRLDALCNIAAVFKPGHTHEMSDSDWEQTLAVNLSAPFKLSRAAIPHLLKTEGAIVNVTSCAAFTGQAYLAAYASTKAALTHMTKCLAMEYMHQPIRINAVAPGGMMTGITEGLRHIREPDITLLSRISPLRGMVEIEDVGDLVAFLATDAARGYHGACINLDNGVTAG